MPRGKRPVVFIHEMPKLVERHETKVQALYQDSVEVAGERFTVNYSLSLDIAGKPHISIGAISAETWGDKHFHRLGWITFGHRASHQSSAVERVFTRTGIISRALGVLERYVKENFNAFRGKKFVSERNGERFIIEQTKVFSALRFLLKNGYKISRVEGLDIQGMPEEQIVRLLKERANFVKIPELGDKLELGRVVFLEKRIE